MRKVLGIVVIAIGLYSCLLLVDAGKHLNITGLAMQELKSEGGTSLAEVYYQDVGNISIGLGTMAKGLGYGTFGICLSLGIKEFKIKGKETAI